MKKFLKIPISSAFLSWFVDRGIPHRIKIERINQAQASGTVQSRELASCSRNNDGKLFTPALCDQVLSQRKQVNNMLIHSSNYLSLHP